MIHMDLRSDFVLKGRLNLEMSKEKSTLDSAVLRKRDVCVSVVHVQWTCSTDPES